VPPLPASPSPPTADASQIPSGHDQYDVQIDKDGIAVVDCTGAPGIAAPDPCIADRVSFPDGDIAITVLTSTLSDWNFSASVCGAAPLLGCQPAAARKAKLKIVERDDRDVVGWTWKSSTTTDPAIFGDPLNGNDYTLCVYDADGMRLHLTAPAGGHCNGVDCWRPTRYGFKFASRVGSTDGVVKLGVSGGGPGKGKIALKASGSLDLPSLPLTPPLLVQMRSKDGACFEARFGTAKRNDSAKLQGVSD
jgi:hypothetical protein